MIRHYPDPRLVRYVFPVMVEDARNFARVEGTQRGADLTLLCETFWSAMMMTDPDTRQASINLALVLGDDLWGGRILEVLDSAIEIADEYIAAVKNDD